MSWTRKVSHPSEVLEKGQEIECKVLSVDQQRRRIALGIKQLSEDPWESDIPTRYQPGQTVTGTVTKLTNFGVFVGLENGLEGLLHISELSDEKVENPEAVVKEGEEIEVRILRVDVEERKIGLSRRSGDIEELQAQHEVVAAEETASSPKSTEPLKGGVGDSSGPLIQTAVEEADTSTDEE
jgi:small subunit ribosomal protein S1